jgi:transcriptional regulator with XRE-family HTH domain
VESPSPSQVRLSRTLYDVAREAGVSTATVSRVVHGQDSVSPATRRRVLEVIEALGYVPDSAAQSMARRSKEVIGLVPMQARSPDTEVEQMGLVFTEEVLRGVESALVPLGWPVLVSGRRPVGAEDAYQWLQRMSAKVDGLLITLVVRESCGCPAGRTEPTALTGNDSNLPLVDGPGTPARRRRSTAGDALPGRECSRRRPCLLTATSRPTSALSLGTSRPVAQSHGTFNQKRL